MVKFPFKMSSELIVFEAGSEKKTMKRFLSLRKP